MKQLFLILTAICITCLANAQKNFQGEITYRLHASGETKPDAELKVSFGINKLRLLFKEKEEYDKEELIVLLDSATVVTLNRDDKTFRKKTLIIKPALKKSVKKSIAGYATTPLQPDDNGITKLLGGLGTTTSIFYLADSLYYFIPDIFMGNMELMMVQKNKIILGADISTSKGYYETTDPGGKTDLITIEAINVKDMPVNDNEFRIPADFEDLAKRVYAPVEDSFATPAVVDTTIAVKPVKKPAKKKPVNPAKPASTNKTSAVRRKE